MKKKLVKVYGQPDPIQEVKRLEVKISLDDAQWRNSLLEMMDRCAFNNPAEPSRYFQIARDQTEIRTHVVHGIEVSYKKQLLRIDTEQSKAAKFAAGHLQKEIPVCSNCGETARKGLMRGLCFRCSGEKSKPIPILPG